MSRDREVFESLLALSPRRIAEAMVRAHEKHPRDILRRFPDLESCIREAVADFFMARSYDAAVFCFTELLEELEAHETLFRSLS